MIGTNCRCSCMVKQENLPKTVDDEVVLVAEAV